MADMVDIVAGVEMKQENEKLSVLLDDDPDGVINTVVDEVVADLNLQYQMRRYQIIGEVMRNELPAAIDTGFHADVMARISDEDASALVTAGAAVGRGGASVAARAWFRPVAGLAVAASVAVVTVALWQPLQKQESGANEALVSADEKKIQQLASQKIAGGAVPASTSLEPVTRWKMENESAVLQQKLNAYLVNHTEYSNSMQGLIPQARVAGFDAQQ